MPARPGKRNSFYMVTKTTPSGSGLEAGKSANQLGNRLIEHPAWNAVALILLATLGFVGWISFGPKPGQSVPFQGRNHIASGEPHEPYNSDPPTSGPHALLPAEAGFYEKAPPDENLVHNMEHGYVIVWYNCSGLSEAECQGLTMQIQGVMDRTKPASFFSSEIMVIVVPRPTLTSLLTLTAWCRILKLDKFDEAVLTDFIGKLAN